MKNLLKSMLLAALLVVGGPILGGTAHAWSLQEAHKLGNEALVRVGDWCSGTVIDKTNGLVVTASHCVQPLKKVIVTKKETHDGTLVKVPITIYAQVALTIDSFTDEGLLYKRGVYKAEFVGQDEITDVAVLRITSSLKGLRAEAVLSTTPPKFGDKVYTIGNPMMLPSVVSDGYISHPRVMIPEIGNIWAIMFTAFIDRGSSSGGLYNDNGEMIGITNWLNPRGGEKLASPVSNVINLLRSLGLTKGDRLVVSQAGAP